jgi:hypothetical protein
LSTKVLTAHNRGSPDVQNQNLRGWGKYFCSGANDCVAVSLRNPKIAFKKCQAGHQLLTPVILATWEAEIRRISVRGQPSKIDFHIPSPK